MNIPQKMMAAIGGLLEIGTPFLVLEVRGMKPETVNYTSKVDGKKRRSRSTTSQRKHSGRTASRFA